MKYTLTECQFAALLHDIGKFGQRTVPKSDLNETELYSVPSDRGYYSHLHSGYTTRFFHEVMNKNDELEFFSSSHHKRESSDFAKIIKRADQIASAIDRSDETFDTVINNKKGRFITSRLHSIFYEVDFGKERRDAQFFLNEITKLGYPCVNFIENNLEKSAEEYESLYKDFIDEVKLDNYRNEVTDYLINRIYALLYKYTTSIPASTYEGSRTYVSLFDHLKLTSAIAGCLYLNEENTEKFYMYEFDVSGIQNFIYLVTQGAETKPKMAKALRGRSILISLLTNAITNAILNEFQLHTSNIIFNTGGGGMILLPYGENIKERLESVERDIKNSIFNLFSSDITFVSGLVEMNSDELEKFKVSKALELKMKLEQEKNHKYSEVINENFFFSKSESQATCNMCGKILKDSSHDRCEMCEQIEKISEFYTHNDEFYIIYDYCVSNKLDDKRVQKVNLNFVNLYLVPKEIKDYLQKYKYIDSINNTYIGNIRFNANLVPKSHKDLLNFEVISKELVPADIGDKKLGILKMDVDNLGAIFAFGLKDRKDKDITLQRSLSKYLTLSRLLELFFSKYLKEICIEVSKSIFDAIDSRTDNSNMFYINYAGGDDLVIIGPAYGIIQLAKTIESRFNDYVLNNNITISAGIHIQNDKSPIRFGIQKANQMLDLSKHQVGKNHISIMGISLTFSKYRELLSEVNQYKSFIETGVISRTSIYNLMMILNEKNYSQYLKTVPFIQYFLFRNVDKRKNSKEHAILLKDLSLLHDQEELSLMVLRLKLTIMFTRKK